MGATFPRLKSWTALENLTNSDLNAEINNILNNLTPAGVDDLSASVGAMRQTTSPGGNGTEIVATSLAGELERIRYVLDLIIGKTYWYESPAVTLEEVNSSLGNSLPSTRIVSGRIISNTSKGPIYLVPHGTNATVTLKGATTPFVYRIAGTLYTISSDVTATGLSLAPSTNNTCLVNDAAMTGQNISKYAGEFDAEYPTITIDTVGSEISGLIGKFAAFKTNTEYFIGYIKSATEITKCFRGLFFDSTDTPFKRVVLTDNDVITLCRLTWIFAKADGTIAVDYTNPVWAFDQPTSSSVGDYWFDLNNQIWKTYNGSAWIDATAILIGMCLQDTAGTKAARSLEFAAVYDSLNTMVLAKYDANTIRSINNGAKVSVCGITYEFGFDPVEWEMAGDLVSGLSETSSTDYYIYLTASGDTLLDIERPYFREELYGKYHPYNAWRCIGKVTNDGSSNFGEVEGIPSGAVIGVEGLALSDSSGAFTTVSTSFVDVTNLSVKISTRGNQVRLQLIPDGNSDTGSITYSAWGISGAATSEWLVYRDSTAIGYMAAILSNRMAPGAFIIIDNPPAGTYTYKIQGKTNNGGIAAIMQWCKLSVKEMK